MSSVKTKVPVINGAEHAWTVSDSRFAIDSQISSVKWTPATDPFFLDRARILGLIEILIQFQVDEVKKQ